MTELAGERVPTQNVALGSLKQVLPPSLRVAWRAMTALARGEPELRLLPRLCSRQKLSIDVGANCGVYSWHLSRLSAATLAFEPQPLHAHFLKRAFGASVRVEQVALSTVSGEGILRIPCEQWQDGRATLEPGNKLDEYAVVECPVQMRRLDSYALEPVGFIKIDVEGHELGVLQGAEGLLRRDRPNLLIEAEDAHRPGAVESVRNHLAGFGYHGFFCFGGAFHDLEREAERAGLGIGSFAAAKGLYNFVFLRDDKAWCSPNRIGRIR